MSGTDATPEPARSYEPRRRELLDDMTARTSLEETADADHADRLSGDTRPSTSDFPLTEGDAVVFTGYAPSKPEIPGTVIQVLRRPADHPCAGQVTGFIIAVDGAHGQTLCAEPDQLRLITPAGFVERTITVHFDGGPWAGRTALMRTVTAPVFAVGDAEGKHYWLDSASDPPTYHWRPEP